MGVCVFIFKSKKRWEVKGVELLMFDSVWGGGDRKRKLWIFDYDLIVNH